MEGIANLGSRVLMGREPRGLWLELLSGIPFSSLSNRLIILLL